VETFLRVLGWHGCANALRRDAPSSRSCSGMSRATSQAWRYTRTESRRIGMVRQSLSVGRWRSRVTSGTMRASMLK
jgi:hypothetical protein